METRWEFRSTALSLPPGESEEFGGRILGAFRSATGLDGRLCWTWETGPRARAWVSSRDLEVQRWIERVMVPTYRPGRWVPVEPQGDLRASVSLGSIAGSPDAVGPFPASTDGLPPWIGPVLELLPTFREGIMLEWQLAPLTPFPQRMTTDPPRALVRQPPGFRVDGPPIARRTIADRLEERILGPQWTATGRLLGNASSALVTAEVERFARLLEASSRREGGSGFGFRRPGRCWSRPAKPIVLSVPEVVAMFPGPATRFIPRLDAITPGVRSLIVGRDGRGTTAVLRIEPNQGRHLVVLGETGMGKSSLLVRLACQLAPDTGLVVFDPVGDTARAVMAGLPGPATRRLLWVSPVHSPVGINALASVRSAPGVSPVRSERALGDLVGALRRVRSSRYADTPFWGPRIEETVSRAILAAAAFPNGTLIDAERLLSQPGRRVHGVPANAVAAVEELRRRVLERPEEVDGARRLLGEVSRSGVLTRMLCQVEPHSSVTDWLRSARITVISGDASETGEGVARYLLSVLLALTWAELLARPAASKTVVLLDEAQWYAHDSVAEMLRLGRRLNVHVWLATQALESLPEGVREAARTNAADFVLYRGSPDEAREFHRWVPSVREEDLLALPRGRAVLLGGKGERVDWISVSAPPLVREIETATEQAAGLSTPYWADGTAEPATPPTEPAGTAIASGTTPAAVEPAIRELLLVLWAGLLDNDPAPSISVLVGALRAALDPGGAAVRAVGAVLARAGAILERRTVPEGHVWVLGREGVAQSVGAGVAPDELTRATTLWRRVAPSVQVVLPMEPFKRSDS